MSTDPVDLDAIEARANAATPGPWIPLYDSCDCDPDYGCSHGQWVHAVSLPTHAVGYESSPCDGAGCIYHSAGEVADFTRETAEFIAAARTDVTALVAEVRRLRGELERARKIAHSWVPTDRLNDYRRHHQAAVLRWAAERTNCLDDSETLRSMADHIAAGDVEVPDE